MLANKKLYKTAILFSIFIHFCIFLSLFPIYKKNKKLDLDIIKYESSIKVDLVGLPNFTKQEIVDVKEEEPPKKDEPVINKKEEIKKKNDEVLLSEKAKTLELLKKKTFAEEEKAKILKNLRGTKTNKQSQNIFIEQVKKLIRSNWSVPQWMENSGLQVVIHITANYNGNIKKYEIIKSSNNKVFDQKALVAVQKSNPLPKIPEDMADTISDDGIYLSFP